MNTFHDNPPARDVPQIVVLDFDRTLSDVGASMERLYAAASAFGLDRAHIEQARRQTEDDGGTFEPLSLLQSELSESDYAKFKAGFVSSKDSIADMLYPDARQLLAKLYDSGIPFIVITYGVSREWQELKITASGIAAGYVIIDTPRKAGELLALRKSGGQFELRTRDGALYRAPALVFVDDKAQAFEDFPQDQAYLGFWLQRGTLLPSQQGTVPPNVRIIHSLDELTLSPPTNA